MHTAEWNGQYSPSPGLVLDLDLAATRARYRGANPAGSHIPGSPGKVLTAGIAVNPGGQWFGCLQWRYFGPHPLTEDNSARGGSAALASASVGYAFGKRTTLVLDVLNLFNRRAGDIDYFDTSLLRASPTPAIRDIHIKPGEPRSLRLTLSGEF
ncbi:TonB-dependent receptor [Massilia endophytica]|nr:TonB-dependent receptor [Massilia endophytica]